MSHPANHNFMFPTFGIPFMFPFNTQSLLGDLPAAPPPPHSLLNGTVHEEAKHPEKQTPHHLDAKRWNLSSTKCDKLKS